MSTALWMNIPLMVLVFGLMSGIPLWLVLRRGDWHGKPEARMVPAYVVRQRREATVQCQRVSRTGRPVRPVADW